MERFTQKEENGYLLPPHLQAQGLKRLGALENLWEGLLARRAEIPQELAALRGAGKEKTVQFRELLAEKLTTNAILDALERCEKWG